MKTTTTVVLTGGITAVGHWAQDKKLDIAFFVGIGVLAIGLAALSEVNLEFAQQLSTLILVAAAFYYGVPISKALMSAFGK